MTHQQPLIPTRHAPDIWKKYRLPGTRRVNEAAWEDARAQRQSVGTCRHAPAGVQCGGYLNPGQPYTVGGRRRMFPTSCSSCGHETAAPGPSPPRKRGRR